MAEALATDATEGHDAALVGTDVLPVELSTHTGRLARLEAALAVIEAEDAKARSEAVARVDKARDAAAEGRKVTGRKPKDSHAALVRAENNAARRAELERAAAAEGHKLRGPRPGPDVGLTQAASALEAARANAQAATPVAKEVNVTDPDSRIMKTKTGWIQGYNAQAAVNEHQVVVGCAVNQDANDVNQYQPMVTLV